MTTAKRAMLERPLVRFAARLANFIFPLSNRLSIISIIAAAGMMFMVTADVFMRRVFNAPIFGAYDVIKVLLVIIVFCAVAEVMRVNEHVVVDTLVRLFPPNLKRLVTGLSYFLSMVILLAICWQSINYGLAMLRAGENMVLLRIPVAPFIFIVAFGYIVFFLVTLAHFIFIIFGVEKNTVTLLTSCTSNYGQH
jgi:TRAP-type transport system small permease protein